MGYVLIIVLFPGIALWLINLWAILQKSTEIAQSFWMNLFPVAYRFRGICSNWVFYIASGRSTGHCIQSHRLFFKKHWSYRNSPVSLGYFFQYRCNFLEIKRLINIGVISCKTHSDKNRPEISGLLDFAREITHC